MIKKIIKRADEYRIYCEKIDDFRNAQDCKKCKKFVSIDPVRSELKCKGE